MRSLPSRKTDVLIIGLGAAGLVCANKLAASGLKVTMIGRGVPASAMSSGCVAGLRDTMALTALGIDPGTISAAQDGAERMFRDMMASSGLDYRMPEAPLVDAHALHHPADYCPRWTLSSADLMAAGSISLVTSEQADLSLLGASLSNRSDKKIEAIDIRLPNGPNIDEAKADPFDSILGALAGSDSELCAIPPSFSLHGFDERMRRLEHSSGRKVREVFSSLGLPGIRMRQALMAAAVAAGATVLDGMDVTGIGTAGGKVESVTLRSGLRSVQMELECLVHCGGGVVGGGLDVDDMDARDPLETFEMESIPGRYGLLNILDQGVKVDPRLHLFMKGTRISNALAAGSILPGICYPRGAGLGTSMVTAVLAAEEVLHDW